MRGQFLTRLKTRRSLWLTLVPALVLWSLGVLWPERLGFFGGAGLGWVLVAQFVLRSRERMEYHAAIRHMRHGDYQQAVTAVDALIDAQPDVAEHRRYRLLTRLWLARNHCRQGRTEAARQQLEQMRKQASGLRDWQVNFESENAAALRPLLETDVTLAQRLLSEQAPLDALGGA